jgi:hypothetical protein
MSKPRRLTRRRAMQVTTAVTALPLVHIRTAGAAGKLSIGLWDHWVPGGTEKMRQQVQAWADKSKVDVTADFITSQGHPFQGLCLLKQTGPDADRGNFAQDEGSFAQVRCKISSRARGGGVMPIHQ